MDGTLRQTEGRIELRFERDLEHPVEKVWSQLTEPRLVKTWLADGGGEIELRVGGRVHLVNGGEDWLNSVVTAIEPPTMIEYAFRGPDWDGGHVRFELARRGEGTRLVLRHEMPEMTDDERRDFAEKYELPEGWEQRASTLAGWHTILDRLPEAMDGNEVDWSDETWKAHHKRYKEALTRV